MHRTTRKQERKDTPVEGVEGEALELLELRDAVVYDAVYGKRYITEQMNVSPGT